MLCKKVFLEISWVNTCGLSLFFSKEAGLRPTTLFKKRLWNNCFPVNFAKFWRTLFVIEHLWWLLLLIVILTTASYYLPKLKTQFWNWVKEIILVLCWNVVTVLWHSSTTAFPTISRSLEAGCDNFQM